MARDGEKWGTIARFPDYEVSDCGGVRRIITRHTTVAGRVLKPWRTPRGYLCYRLRDRDGRFVSIVASRLVLFAFVGEPPTPGAHAAHNNGAPDDNSVKNLRWASPKENEADKLQHGTRLMHERHHQAKLTARDVTSIRRRLRAGAQGTVLAREYGVVPSLISAIKNERIWRGIA